MQEDNNDSIKKNYDAANISADLVCLYLRDGRRTPQNEYEKRLLAEIKEIEAAGGTIEVFAD